MGDARARKPPSAAPKDALAGLAQSNTSWRNSPVAMVLLVAVFVLCGVWGVLGPRKAALPQKLTEETYRVVFDAGSTGSRVHVFRFGPNAKVLPIAGGSEFFQQVKPGVGAYRDSPQDVRKGMRELMQAAMVHIPKGQQPEVQLGATAGLRLLPEEARAALLLNIEAALREFPVTVKEDAVRILDPVDEGAFQWLSVHSMDPDPIVLDWGGASMQIAFPVEPGLRGKGAKTYRGPNGPVSLFCESFLGKGLMALRSRVKDLEGGFPCVAEGQEVTFTLGPTTVSGKGQGCQRCREAAKAAVSSCADDKCNIVRPSPGMPQGDVALTSFFFDRAQDVGLASPPEAWLSAGAFGAQADERCGGSDFLALDLALAQAAVDAMGLGTHRVKVLKQLKGPDGTMEVAWPLGLAVNSLP